MLGGLSTQYQEDTLYIELLEGLNLTTNENSNTYIEIKLMDIQKNREKEQKFKSIIKAGSQTQWNQLSWYEVLPIDEIKVSL